MRLSPELVGLSVRAESPVLLLQLSQPFTAQSFLVIVGLGKPADFRKGTSNREQGAWPHVVRKVLEGKEHPHRGRSKLEAIDDAHQTEKGDMKGRKVPGLVVATPMAVLQRET